jgi:hypothetical protein
MPDWLELELAESLRPAEAPPELWHRIQEGRRGPTRHDCWGALRVPAFAAALLLAAVAGMFWPGQRAAVPAQLPRAAVTVEGARVIRRGADPAEARAACLLCHANL